MGSPSFVEKKRNKILNIIIVNTFKMNCKNMIAIFDTVLFEPICNVYNMFFLSVHMMRVLHTFSKRTFLSIYYLQQTDAF